MSGNQRPFRLPNMSRANGGNMGSSNKQACQLGWCNVNVIDDDLGKGIPKPEIKGGFFTNAVTQVLGAERAKHDSNGNGAIEISELCLAAKT